MSKDQDREKKWTNSYSLAADFYASQGLDFLIPNSIYATDKKHEKKNTHSTTAQWGKPVTVRSHTSVSGASYYNLHVPTTYTFQRPTSRLNVDNNPAGFCIQRHTDRPKMKDLLLKPGCAAEMRSESEHQQELNDSRFNPGEDFAYKRPTLASRPSDEELFSLYHPSVLTYGKPSTHTEENTRKRKYKFEEVVASGYIPEAKRGKSDEPDNFSMNDDKIDDELKDIGWRILQGRSICQITNEINAEDKNKNAVEKTCIPSTSGIQHRRNSKFDTVEKIPGTFVTLLNDEPTLVNWYAYAPCGNPGRLPTHTPHNEKLKAMAFENEKRWTTARLLAAKTKLRMMIAREPQKDSYAGAGTKDFLYRFDSNLYFDFSAKTWKEYERTDLRNVEKPSTSNDRMFRIHNSSDRKRKWREETESAAEQDDLFSECIFIPGPSTKKSRRDENNNDEQE